MNKRSELERRLRKLKSVCVAFSGGVDSALLLAQAHRVFGNRGCVAVLAKGPLFPEKETEEALAWLKSSKIRYRTFYFNPLNKAAFLDNPVDRCYHCKLEMFSKIKSIADDENAAVVVDGSIADDLVDFRPGLRALEDLGVKSPLLEIGMDKKTVRALARELGLPQSGKASQACLASRIPCGHKIDEKKLEQVRRLEDHISGMGFSICRARHHGDLLRIELGLNELQAFFRNTRARVEITAAAKALGFTYITVDLQAYNRAAKTGQPCSWPRS